MPFVLFILDLPREPLAGGKKSSGDKPSKNKNANFSNDSSAKM